MKLGNSLYVGTVLRLLAAICFTDSDIFIFIGIFYLCFFLANVVAFYVLWAKHIGFSAVQCFMLLTPNVKVNVVAF